MEEGDEDGDTDRATIQGPKHGIGCAIFRSSDLGFGFQHRVYTANCKKCQRKPRIVAKSSASKWLHTAMGDLCGNLEKNVVVDVSDGFVRGRFALGHGENDRPVEQQSGASCGVIRTGLWSRWQNRASSDEQTQMRRMYAVGSRLELVLLADLESLRSEVRCKPRSPGLQ